MGTVGDKELQTHHVTLRACRNAITVLLRPPNSLVASDVCLKLRSPMTLTYKGNVTVLQLNVYFYFTSVVLIEIDFIREIKVHFSKLQ
jgi:hypothetical protein